MDTTRSFTRSIVLLAALMALATESVSAVEPDTSNDNEKNLIAVLRSSASPADRALVCKETGNQRIKRGRS